MERDPFAQCHPAVVLAYFAVVVVTTAVVQHPAYLAASLAAAAGYCVMLRGRAGLAILAGLLPLVLVVALVNPLFNTAGAHVLGTVFGRPYTLEALCWGAVLGAMLAAMLAWFACYGQAVTGDKLTYLFGNLAPSVSIMVVMALRMVPDLMRRGVQVATARRCIGLGVREGAGLREKAAAGAGVLSALADHALEGSVCTADSMRARGWGAGRRTNYQAWRPCARDAALLAAIVVLAAAVLAGGGLGARFTPAIAIDPLTWGFAAWCALLLIPAVLRAWEEVLWRTSLWNI